MPIPEDEISFVLRHLPAVATTLLVATLGVILDERVFTKAKAKAEGGTGMVSAVRDWMPLLLPLAAGCAGLIWDDPYRNGWTVARSIAFYVTCGVCAFPIYIVVRRRYHVRLPGDRNGNGNGTGSGGVRPSAKPDPEKAGRQPGAK